MLHLGMSGSVRIINQDEPAAKHDHVDIQLSNGKALRFRDPRRFGSLTGAEDPARHPLLRDLGPEPLSDDFDGDHLWHHARGRKICIKPFIMNASIVVGVGNIYASEALYGAGIHPKRRAGRVSRTRMRGPRHRDPLGTRACDRGRRHDAHAISTAATASPAGSSRNEDVYGRDDEPCHRCG